MKDFKKKRIHKIAINAMMATVFVVLVCLLLINETAINFSINGAENVFANSFQVHILDVGQASASVVIFPQKSAMIIDTGSLSSEGEFIKSVDHILMKNQIKEIDYLFLTHSDEDHIGGTKRLLEKYQVNRIFRPKILSSKSEFDREKDGMIDVSTEIYKQTIDAVYAEPSCSVEFVSDKSFYIYDVEVDVWSAEKTTIVSPNYYSPFIRVKYGNRNFLFTGDATEKREEEFLSKYNELGESFNVDFLLVSHHGASSSSSKQFLEKIKPEFAIISSGDSLHPAKDVIDRLEQSGVKKIYQTKTMGSVMFGVKSSGTFTSCCLTFALDSAYMIFVLSIILLVSIKFVDEKATFDKKYAVGKANAKKFFA